MKNKRISLPKNIYITHLDKKRYAIEYTKFGLEPDTKEITKINSVLRKTFSKVAKDIGSKSASKDATRCWIRDGELAVGFTFTSKLGLDDMDELFDLGIDSVEDY